MSILTFVEEAYINSYMQIIKYINIKCNAELKHLKLSSDDSSVVFKAVHINYKPHSERLTHRVLTQHVINKDGRVTCEGLTLWLIEKASIIRGHFTCLSTCFCMEEVTLWTGSRQLNLDKLTVQTEPGGGLPRPWSHPAPYTDFYLTGSGPWFSLFPRVVVEGNPTQNIPTGGSYSPEDTHTDPLSSTVLFDWQFKVFGTVQVQFIPTSSSLLLWKDAVILFRKTSNHQPKIQCSYCYCYYYLNSAAWTEPVFGFWINSITLKYYFFCDWNDEEHWIWVSSSPLQPNHGFCSF